MSTNFLVAWVNAFQQSALYKNYLSHLPEGLNNAYFLLLVIIGVIIWLVITAKNLIMAAIYNSRNKERIKQLRMQQEANDRERELRRVEEQNVKKTVPENGLEKVPELEEAPKITDVPIVEENKLAHNPRSNMSLLGLDETGEYSDRELYDLKKAKEIHSDAPVEEKEQVRERIDYAPILDEKKAEDRPNEESDGLDDILSNLESKRANDRALKDFEEKNRETQMKNRAILERNIKNGLRVENKD